VTARIRSLGALDHQHRDLHSIKLSYLMEDRASSSVTFAHDRDLFLRLQNEFPNNAMRAIHDDNGTKFKSTHFETFCASLGLEH
jgi:hypothetical protein